MSTILRKAVILSYPDKMPAALPLRLEEAGYHVEVRDADKAREATRALPVGCEVVICLGSNSYGNALALAAKKAGAKVFSGSGGSRIMAALDAAGVIRASDEETARIDIGVVGDLTKRQKEEVIATVRKWSRGAARVAHWLERGVGKVTPEAGLHGYIIVADHTPKEVRQSFRQYLADVERGRVGGALARFEVPCVTARYEEIVRTDGDSNAVLGKWFVQLERAFAKVAEQIDAAAAPKPEGPPVWLVRQTEREEEAKREAAERRKAEEVAEASRATLARLQVEADHEEALRENAHRLAAASMPPPEQIHEGPAGAAPSPEERAAAREEAAAASGTWIGGVEVIPLDAAAAAIFTTSGTLKSLSDTGKITLTLINGTPFISYAELEKAEEAMAPMMDAASDYEVKPARADCLFTTVEAAAYLGCSPGTVNRKTNEGLIRRAAKDGRAWLYDRAALDDWRERRKVIATMRRRTGPLGLPNAGRAEVPEHLSQEARAEVKKLAERMQVLLGPASYASVTVGPDAIMAKRVQIEEEEL